MPSWPSSPPGETREAHEAREAREAREAIDGEAVARRVSGALLRVRRGAPFFAALMLFARFIPRDDVRTACTDGRDVFYNPAFLAPLPGPELDAVLLHEVLHAALLHQVRRGARERGRWGLAADIVVNGIVAAQPGMTVPRIGVREPELEHLDVEEIYALLATRTILVSPCCLRPAPGMGPGALAGIEAHWQRALRQAEAVARATARGALPVGFERLVRPLVPQIDWRAQLWRFLAQTPTDFGDFDRRFVHLGLYLEGLVGESLRAFIAVDTSGSIDADHLSSFTAEVNGVLAAYPHVHAELYYADADVYGPFEVAAHRPLPPPRGGGGTRFEPFFERIALASAGCASSVILYLTDGHGSFPEAAPAAPVLWVVTAGGARDEAFPFGSVVRLLDDGTTGLGRS